MVRFAILFQFSFVACSFFQLHFTLAICCIEECKKCPISHLSFISNSSAPIFFSLISEKISEGSSSSRNTSKECFPWEESQRTCSSQGRQGSRRSFFLQGDMQGNYHPSQPSLPCWCYCHNSQLN